MKQDTMRKTGVWIILILTSLALIIPSIAIIWSIFTAETQEITLNSDNITITTMTPDPVENNTETDTSNTTPEAAIQSTIATPETSPAQ